MDTIRSIINGIDWPWFTSNVANVTGLVLALGGILLNFKTDGKATKLLGAIMLGLAIIIIAGKLLYQNGIVPLA